MAKNSIDTSHILFSQKWQIKNYQWFGDDTIILKSITQRQINGKPTTGKHQHFFDYFYFDSVQNINYRRHIPGGCAIGFPLRSLDSFIRKGNHIIVMFSNHFHKRSPNSPYENIEGTMVYSIAEFKNHKVTLIRKR